MVRLAPRELEKVNYSKSLKESCLNTVADLHTKFLMSYRAINCKLWSDLFYQAKFFAFAIRQESSALPSVFYKLHLLFRFVK